MRGRVCTRQTGLVNSLAILRSTIPPNSKDNENREDGNVETTYDWPKAEMRRDSRPEGNSGDCFGKLCGAGLSGCDDAWPSLHNARSMLLAADHCRLIIFPPWVFLQPVDRLDARSHI